MKISISELEAPTEILDLDRATVKEIVGGATFGETIVNVGATGETTSADSFAFSFSFDVPSEFGGGSIILTGGLGIASDSIFPVSLGFS